MEYLTVEIRVPTSTKNTWWHLPEGAERFPPTEEGLSAALKDAGAWAGALQRANGAGEARVVSMPEREEVYPGGLKGRGK